MPLGVKPNLSAVPRDDAILISVVVNMSPNPKIK